LKLLHIVLKNLATLSKLFVPLVSQAGYEPGDSDAHEAESELKSAHIVCSREH